MESLNKHLQPSEWHESLEGDVKSGLYNPSCLAFERPKERTSKDCKQTEDCPSSQGRSLTDKIKKKVADRKGGNIHKPMRRPKCSPEDILKAVDDGSAKEEVLVAKLNCGINEDQTTEVVKNSEKICFPGEPIAHVFHEDIDESEAENMKSQTDLKIFVEAKLLFKATAPKNNPLQRPIGIAQFESGYMVVADTFNNRMVMFDDTGKFLHAFSSPGGLRHPSAVVVFGDGNFAVKDNNSITVFSELCEVTAIKKLNRPFGLTLNDDGNLVTVETNKYGILSVVFVDPESCGLLSKVTIDLCLTDEEKAESKPRFIAWQGACRLLVVDLGLNRVYIVDTTKGQLIKSFGKFGSGKGQMNDPSGIVCDIDGVILLGDSRNHRVLMYSPDGDFMSVVKMDIPVLRPSGLFLTSDGNLLVLNYWENSLAQYQLKLGEEPGL